MYMTTIRPANRNNTATTMRFLIVLWLLFSLTLSVQAQQRKPDVIYLNNSTRITGYIVSILKQQIQYRLSQKIGTPILTIPRSQVKSIRYGSGKTVILSRIKTGYNTTHPSSASASVKLAEKTIIPSTTNATDINDSTSRHNRSTTPLSTTTSYDSNGQPQPSVIKIRNNRSYYGLSVFFHTSITQLVGNADWTDGVNDIGFKQGIGADIQAQYRFKRKLALALTGAYTNWQVLRNYLSPINQEPVIGWKSKLTHLDGLLSLKIYPVGSVYVAPEAGITLIKYQLQQVYQGIAGNPVTNQIFTPTAGFSLGSEIRLGQLSVDLNGFGRYLFSQYSEQFRPQSVTRIGIRVGIGFSSKISK